MRKIFVLCAVLFVGNAALAAAPVGKVAEVTGSVSITHEGEKKGTPAAVNTALQLKDIVETKKDGIVKLILKDGTTLVLREKSKIMITEHLIFDVPVGKLKVQTSKKIQFKTPTAVVGVRGTEFALEVLKKKTVVYCLKGLLQTFNPLFPEKIVSIATGNFTNVLFGKIPELPIPIPREVLDTIESYFGFPTSIESLKQRAIDEVRGRLPF